MVDKNEIGLVEVGLNERDKNGIGFNEEYNEKVMLEDMNEGDVGEWEWRDLVGKILKDIRLKEFCSKRYEWSSFVEEIWEGVLVRKSLF